MHAWLARWEEIKKETWRGEREKGGRRKGEVVRGWSEKERERHEKLGDWEVE